MPVRSLRSSVLNWPGSDEVIAAARAWATAQAAACDGIVGIACFGSYAQGDEGPGSDLDLIVIVETSSEPFERRSMCFDATDLPVPVDLLVYTRAEFVGICGSDSRFAHTLRDEAVWLVGSGA